jgi:diguanylate cyclase (GGDEF)-like protein
LTTAFLAAVLGPVLLGAFFVGGTVTAVSRDRSLDRLDVAATTVRTSVGSLCRQLQSAADTIAVLSATDRRAAADQIVARDLASAVHVADADGRSVFTTAGPLTEPWTDCAGPDSAPPTAGRPVPGGPLRAIAARVELRDTGGAGLGSVQVARALDAILIERLAAATGVAVTLLGGVGPTIVHSTESGPARREVATLAAALGTGETAATPHGRYVRRVGPVPGQPLSLAVSAPGGDPRGLYVVLVGGVLLVGLFVVLAAGWLARSTTRPLAELARAAGRVADGDLDARVPIRRQDEIGRLAGTFNRMTRELQAYVQALTASRDQLRNHLEILGDTLSSTHDLHRILQVILQTALAATGARAGLVLLADPATGTLVGQCAEGLTGRWPSPTADHNEVGALRLAPGEGVLGAVGAQGEPRRGRVAPDGRPLSAGEPRCRTFVAVPICAPAPPTGDLPGAGITPRQAGVLRPTPAAGLPLPVVTLGVLALYDRLGRDDFDDLDLGTLRTFAGHAGVALNNVRIHEEAQRLSLTDPLTGLWNYRYLRESIRREVERANRFGRMLTVLVLDLDRFKEVNDSYGHAAGDDVLIEFARRVRAEVREVDLAFRQGGEEFVVLLPETDARGGVIVAERLGAAVRDRPVTIDPHRVDGVTGTVVRSVQITVSIGIGVYPDHAGTAQQVLAAADDALYAAKAAGRDTYRVAVSDAPPRGQELAVAAGAVTPDDGLPRAGGPSGAPGGPQPPRQSRSR